MTWSSQSTVMVNQVGLLGHLSARRKDDIDLHDGIVSDWDLLT